MFSRGILVGVDPDHGALRPGSRRAVDLALALAEREGAALTLLYAAAPDESWSAKDQSFAYRQVDRSPDLRAALDALVEECRARGVEAELVQAEERADRAILRRVLDRGADLVVTGKRNHDDDDGRRLGSVAAKLIRHCPTPVAVLRPDRALPLRTVLVAADLTPTGDRALDLGARFAACVGASLHVLHAFQMPLSVQIEDQEAEYVATTRKRCREQIEARLRDVGSSPAQIHVGLASPTPAILEAVERFDVDLVVMGTVSRGGLAGWLVGNTAERLLGRLACSLLVVKPEDFACPPEALGDASRAS
jgi:universal stress protein E